jgi:hypothetical protein
VISVSPTISCEQRLNKYSIETIPELSPLKLGIYPMLRDQAPR